VIFLSFIEASPKHISSLHFRIDELWQTLDDMELALEHLEEKVNDLEGRTSVKKCGCQLCLMKMAREAKLYGKK
jgi:hypothetical protein